MYAHYFGFFILWTQFIFLLFDFRFFTRHFKKVWLYLGLLTVGYAPNVNVLIHRFADSSGGTWVKPPEGIESLYNMLWTYSNAPVVAVSVLAMFGGALIHYFAQRNAPRPSIFSRLVLFWFGFIVCFMFAVSFQVPIFMDRYTMPAAVAFPLLIGISADFLVQKSWARFLIPTVLCGMFVFTVKPNSNNGRDIQAIVQKVKSLQTNGSMVYICPDWFDLNFVYYYNRGYFEDVNEVHIKDNLRAHLRADHVFPIHHAEQIAKQSLTKVNRIIYLDTGADFTYPNNGIRAYLATHFELKEEIRFDELFQVLVYEKSKR